MRPSRRTLLRGAASALALPWLPSLARAAAAAPRRLVVFFVPNGMPMHAFVPQDSGPDYTLSPILAPLAPVRAHVAVHSGLANRAGDVERKYRHSAGTASLLTGVTIDTDAAVPRAGVSADQVAAASLGMGTPLPSLQLAVDAPQGGCPPTTCVYETALSWASPTRPLPNLTDPRVAFDLLFAGSDPRASAAEAARRRDQQRSVIDDHLEHTAALAARASAADRVQLDGYLTGLRELERRLEGLGAACDSAQRPGAAPPFDEAARAMTDLLLTALRCDLTRIATLMLGPGSSYADFGFLGVPETHHAVSHHGQDAQRLAWGETIGRWEVERFVELVSAMAALDGGDGRSLLDNSAVLFVSELGDGDTHGMRQLPVLLAGTAGGRLAMGTHRAWRDRTVHELLLGVLHALDVPADHLGDTTTALQLG
ncbi:MAG: hypothetical protein ACI8PZ_007261 [Myxococcota bacterium]